MSVFCLKEGVGYRKLCVPHLTAKHERKGLEESHQLPHEKDFVSGAQAKGVCMCTCVFFPEHCVEECKSFTLYAYTVKL